MRTHSRQIAFFACFALAGCTAPNPEFGAVAAEASDEQLPDADGDVDDRVADDIGASDGASLGTDGGEQSDAGWDMSGGDGDAFPPEPDAEDGSSEDATDDVGQSPDVPQDGEDPLPCDGEVCAPSDTCAGGTATVRSWTGACSSDGQCVYDEEQIECAAGCCADGCCEVVPANIGRFGRLQHTGRMIVAPTRFHTSEDCRLDGPLGVCAVIEPAAGVSACVCRADDLEVGDLRVEGPHALVLLVAGSVEISGVLDVSAHGAESGPGASGTQANPAQTRAGGSGGSFGSQGGAAPDAGRFPVRGGPSLEPLWAGSEGQATCRSQGGGGGGGLQITAGGTLSIDGAILAGGGGGDGGHDRLNCSGGAGGGSGGAVLLEAPRVRIEGQIHAAGGGGGSGGAGNEPERVHGARGSDASPDASPAEGGASRSKPSCPLSSIRSGGGGYGADRGLQAGSGGAGESESCVVGEHAGGDGGGGGGLGRVRINTVDECDCEGEMTPAPTFGQLGTREER